MWSDCATRFANLNSCLDKTLPSDLRAMPTFRLHYEDATDLALQFAHLQASGYVRLIVDDQTFNISDDNRELLSERVVRASVY